MDRGRLEIPASAAHFAAYTPNPASAAFLEELQQGKVPTKKSPEARRVYGKISYCFRWADVVCHSIKTGSSASKISI